MLIHRFAMLTVLVGALLPGIAVGQDKVELRFLTAWDDRFDGTVVVAQKFAESVEKASDGRVSFKFSGPEVIPPNQQFDPVSQGVFDLGFITPVYFLGTTGVLSGFFALPPNSQLWRDKGYWDYADEELKRFNQKLIAFTSGTGESDFYQIILREPLGEGDQALTGKKIRGNKYYEPIVGSLGGSLVNLPGGEIYSALEKGVVDGAAYPIAGMQRLKMQEVAKYMMRPRFGTSPFVVTMNLDKFNALSEEDQAMLLEAGKQVEQSSTEDFARLSLETIAELKAAGMQETELSPEVFEKINSGLIEGSWQTAVDGNEKTADRVNALREMAKANGDAK